MIQLNMDLNRNSYIMYEAMSASEYVYPANNVK